MAKKEVKAPSVNPGRRIARVCGHLGGAHDSIARVQEAMADVERRAGEIAAELDALNDHSPLADTIRKGLAKFSLVFQETQSVFSDFRRTFHHHKFYPHERGPFSPIGGAESNSRTPVTRGRKAGGDSGRNKPHRVE